MVLERLQDLWRNLPNTPEYFSFTDKDVSPSKVFQLCFKDRVFTFNSDVFKFIKTGFHLDKLKEEDAYQVLIRLKELSDMLDESKLRQLLSSQPSISTKEVSGDLIPRKAVEIKSSAGFSLVAFFHDVIINKRYIILVFDSRAVGYTKFIPEEGSGFRIRVPGVINQEVQVFSLGHLFTHGDYEYYLMVEKPEEKKDEETDDSL